MNVQTHFWNASDKDWEQDGNPAPTTATMPVNVALMVVGPTWLSRATAPHTPKVNYSVRV